MGCIWDWEKGEGFYTISHKKAQSILDPSFVLFCGAVCLVYEARFGCSFQSRLRKHPQKNPCSES